MLDETEKNISQLLGEGLKVNEVLRNHVSLQVGGVADYYFVANDLTSLTRAVSAASKLGIPYFILGGGYNVVPSDMGFPGLVIKNESPNIAFSPDFSTVIVDSGVNLGRLINQAASHDLGGLEFLFGIPGTTGGAIYGNAGAFGYSISDFVKSVTVVTPIDGELTIERHDKDWMNFSYRSSILKERHNESANQSVIMTATIQLVQRRKDEILRMMQENIRMRKHKQPLEHKSAGSFFKNIDSTPEKSAGYLLDKAGAKRLRVGGAAFSKKHANFLINAKNATASDVFALAEKAKDLVREKTDLYLEEEIEYIGKW